MVEGQEIFDGKRDEPNESDDRGTPKIEQELGAQKQELGAQSNEASLSSSIGEAQLHVIHNLSEVKKEKMLVRRIGRMLWPFGKRRTHRRE